MQRTFLRLPETSLEKCFIFTQKERSKNISNTVIPDPEPMKVKERLARARCALKSEP